MLYRRCNEMHRNSRPVLGHPSPLIVRFEMAYRGSVAQRRESSRGEGCMFAILF